MKKRNAFMSIIMLIAILTLGVGYALISNTSLSIAGSAAAVGSDANFKVRFDSTTTPTTTVPENAQATAAITGELAATIEVTNLTTKDQVATATYTIENYSDELSASLAATVTNNNDDYFDVTYSFDKTAIEAGEKAEITVSVRMVKTPIDSQSATISVGLTATAVEK